MATLTTHGIIWMMMQLRTDDGQRLLQRILARRGLWYLVRPPACGAMHLPLERPGAMPPVLML